MKETPRIMLVLYSTVLGTIIAVAMAVLYLAGPASAQLVGDDPYILSDPGKQPPRQQYNPMENRWETVQGQKQLKYNAFENEWSYQNPNARPVYNSFENTWEFPK